MLEDIRRMKEMGQIARAGERCSLKFLRLWDPLSGKFDPEAGMACSECRLVKYSVVVGTHLYLCKWLQ